MIQEDNTSLPSHTSEETDTYTIHKHTAHTLNKQTQLQQQEKGTNG